MKRVPFVDITGLQTLEEVIQQLHKRHIVVKLCEANRKVLSKLDKAGILKTLGTGHYHDAFIAALEEEVQATPPSP
ncbi:STAS domain protein [compost metagenome]